MDQSGVIVHADVDFHAVGEAFRVAVIPLVGFLGLVYFGSPLSSLLFGRAGSCDQSCIDDRAYLRGDGTPESLHHQGSGH